MRIGRTHTLESRRLDFSRADQVCSQQGCHLAGRDVAAQRMAVRDPVGQAVQQFYLFGLARFSRLLDVVKVFQPTARGEPVVGEAHLGTGEAFALRRLGPPGFLEVFGIHSVGQRLADL